MDIRTNQAGIPGDTQGLSKEYHGHFSNRPEANLQKENPPAADKRFIQVQLLGINDLHGQLNVTRKVNGKPVGRVDYLAAYLKQRASQNKNTIMVHSGDMVGASPPLSALLQDEPTIEILNKLNYGIGTVGNHEFDEGVQELLRLINGGTSDKTGNFVGANFPNIVANVVDKKTGDPILSPYKVLKVNGIEIGFIGVVTTDTPSIVIPSGVEGVKFTDEVDAINRYVPELQKQGVRSIVVLAHDPGTSGINGENPTGKLVDMANGVDDEVDVIFGGHNHAYMNATINNKLVIQAYSYGTAFSDVYLQIDPKTKDIVSKKADIVTTFQDGITPDSEIKNMVEGYEAKVAPLVNRVIGTTTDGLTSLQNANGESVLGDLIADSQRNSMKTDFAFMNPGGIRADLDPGDITWGQAYTVQPFNNALIKMTMTGQQVRDVLNQQWGATSTNMLQISGLTYTWDANHPTGQKVTSILLPDGTPIDPNKTYTVVANAFLAGGGDGFTVFNQGQNRETGPIDLDAFVDYLKTLPTPFTYSMGNRIHRVQY
ncbi:bifunctional metallophosphatase/5'-nucleotidase [Neobacillus cucumis]|uniref:Bifunctional metallophosphatase/5'-nucleotidase n=2 Tax=Neobacillus cucumis TaxID=1740721 RepID=A0A2N5HP79_9BACI|nr:bifunctional metallophosphatase/5'-nucleotidase [Neobacillus cucumis]